VHSTGINLLAAGRPVLADMLAGSIWTGEHTQASPPPFTGRYQLHHLSLLLFYLISALILYRSDGDLRSIEKINNSSSPVQLYLYSSEMIYREKKKITDFSNH
jgi:hypothetical protein